MRTSRALPAAALAVLLGTALAACGSDQKDGRSASTARTESCRIYLLNGGAGAPDLAKDLTGITSQGYEAEAVAMRLTTVEAAVKLAGIVPDLSDRDFKLYSDLAAALDSLSAAVAPINDSSGIEDSDVIAFGKAAQLVYDRCS